MLFVQVSKAGNAGPSYGGEALFTCDDEDEELDLDPGVSGFHNRAPKTAPPS